MPKRSFADKLNYYSQKIHKLKEKESRKRRRLEDSNSLSDEDNLNYLADNQTTLGDPMGPLSIQEEIEPLLDADMPVNIVDLLAPDDEAPTRVTSDPVSTLQTELTTTPPVNLEATPLPPLDPEILVALGEATNAGPVWGQEIHNNLPQLWEPLLKKGMDKETKQHFFKQYLIPSNCTMLQAPKLNIEISAAILEMVKLRDKKVEANQQQLGVGITAVSKAMTLLLTGENKIENIKTLSDGCRILCDLHHSETLARIKMITSGLAKPFLNVIQDSERDETLFGISLPEKIKASKTIEKQGLQIKKVTQPSRLNPAASSTISTRPQVQGNWNGPPRYPANRGGRGGHRRYPTTSRRPAPTVSAQPRGVTSKPRVPPRP